MTTFSKTTENFFSLVSKPWNSTTYFPPGETNSLPKWERTETAYSEFVITRKSTAIPCVWQRLRQALKWGSFVDKENSRNALIWGCGPAAAGGGLTRARYLMWLVWAYLSFSNWLWVEMRVVVAKNREAGSHWPSPDLSRPMPQRLWVRVVLSCTVWLSSGGIFILSPWTVSHLLS